MGIIEKTLRENYIFFTRELARINEEIIKLPRGGISAKRIGGSTYYYHQWREGRKVKSRSLGKGMPVDLAEALARRKTFESQKSEILENLQTIVKAIDAQRVTVEEILRVFSKHGIRVTLIGSYCMPIYRDMWKMNLPSIRTQDVDFLVPVPYTGKQTNIEPLLADLGFSIGFYPDGSTYFTNGLFKVEFLTPERGKGSNKATPIKELRISATPLRYLQMLHDHEVFLEVEDFTLSLPNPWVFAYHKILVARARKKPEKKEKDLLQALAILREIARRPEELKQARSYLKTLPGPWIRWIRTALEGNLPSFLQDL
jgi:hypothetical protein